MAIEIPVNHNPAYYGSSARNEQDPLTALVSLTATDVREEHGVLPVYKAEFLIPFNAVQDIAYGTFILTTAGGSSRRPKVTAAYTSEGMRLSAHVVPACRVNENRDCYFEINPQALPSYWDEDEREAFLFNHPCGGEIYDVGMFFFEGDAEKLNLQSDFFMDIKEELLGIGDPSVARGVIYCWDTVFHDTFTQGASTWWFVGGIHED